MSKIVIEGNLKWIIPLLIILASISFTLYMLYPTYEFFTNKNNKKLQDKEKEIEILKNLIKHEVKEVKENFIQKENFETYTTVEKKKPVTGYNSVDYSEFAFDTVKVKPVKFIQEDINKKITEYESTNILNEYKPHRMNPPTLKSLKDDLS